MEGLYLHKNYYLGLTTLLKTPFDDLVIFLLCINFYSFHNIIKWLLHFGFII